VRTRSIDTGVFGADVKVVASDWLMVASSIETNFKSTGIVIHTHNSLRLARLTYCLQISEQRSSTSEVFLKLPNKPTGEVFGDGFWEIGGWGVEEG